MTIDEAIELQETYLEAVEPEAYGDLEEAIKLGIEALKVIKDVRPTDYAAIDEPLPGETAK